MMSNDSRSDAPIWIADLVFQRHNRSVKYAGDGQLLILSEMSEWADICPRLIANAEWIGIFVSALLLNFLLFVLSLRKARHQAGQKKLNCYLGNLAFCNLVIALGDLVCIFLIDVYYDVDSFATLVKLNRGERFSTAWQLAKQVVHNEMVESFALAQSLILLTACADRYFSLLDGYVPFVRRARLRVVLALLAPYVLALGVFDDKILRLLFARHIVNIIRSSALLAGPLLSVAFVFCSLLQRITRCRRSKRRDGRGTRIGGCSADVALALIVGAQIVERVGLFLELLKHNFMIELVVGEAEADALLRRWLTVGYRISHLLFITSPLYCALLCILFVPYYRGKLTDASRGAARRIFCRKKPRLDYSSETMRSIIAEQQRARQMRANISPIY